MRSAQQKYNETYRVKHSDEKRIGLWIPLVLLKPFDLAWKRRGYKSRTACVSEFMRTFPEKKEK